MKKNKNLIYLLLLAGAAVAFIAFKKKPKLKGKVIVDDLQKITEEEFKTETQPDILIREVKKTETQPDILIREVKETETQPDILIREVKEAVESTPEPLSTILTKAKGLFKKPIKKLKPTKAIFKPTLKPKIKMPTLVIPKIKQSKKVIKKAKKRLKGFDDISVLY